MIPTITPTQSPSVRVHPSREVNAERSNSALPLEIMLCHVPVIKDGISHRSHNPLGTVPPSPLCGPSLRFQIKL